MAQVGSGGRDVLRAQGPVGEALGAMRTGLRGWVAGRWRGWARRGTGGTQWQVPSVATEAGAPFQVPSVLARDPGQVRSYPEWRSDQALHLSLRERAVGALSL